MPEPKIRVIIVNYFKAARLLEGVQSLGLQTAANFLEIVVIDNSCDEKEWETLQALRGFALLERSQTNVGYVSAVNHALMSPDIIVQDTHAIRKLAESLETDESIGTIAPIQYDDHGNLVEVARRFPSPWRLISRRLLSRDTNSDINLSPSSSSQQVEKEVDWVQSSFVLIRNDLINAIGGLSTKYWLFMADTELGHQTRQHNYRTIITNSTQVRSDGVRASNGGILALLRTKAGRAHIRDAMFYFFGRVQFNAHR
jgi:N-acetylglucosaminyl-diphospho-decaprenol L-rhamnosyltransferase